MLKLKNKNKQRKEWYIMKKKTKTLLLSMIAVAMLASCGKKNAGTEDVTEVDFLLSSSAASAEDFIWNNIMEEKFGLKVNFEMAAQSAHLEKLQLLIASNNLPDIISPLPSDTAKKIGISGMLYDYNKSIDKMPDFEKIIKEDMTSYVSLLAEDGGLYVAPQTTMEANNFVYFRYLPSIREDLVKEVGMDIPETFDELYEVLKAIKEKHPETVGLINRTGTDIFKDMGYYYGTRTDVHYSFEEDKYVFGPESENYKEMLKYLNKLWKEGLADPELFTASKTQFESKLINGLGVFYIDWPEYSSQYTKTHMSLFEDGKDDFSIVPMGPLTSSIYQRKIVQKMPVTNDYCSIAISANSEATDKLVKFVNWLYSDEGTDISSYGIKDEHYTVETDGLYRFVENIMADYNPNGTIEKDKVFGINLPHMRRVGTDKEYNVENEYVKRTNEVLDVLRKSEYPYQTNNGIVLTYTEEEIEERNAIQSDINTCVNEWSIGLVTGEKSFDDYDKFIAETKKRGVDKLVKISNAAYDHLKERRGDGK